MAKFTTDTRQIRSVLASTLETMINGGVVADAIYQKRWLLNKLTNADATTLLDGGERLRGNFQYIKNTTATSYSGDDVLDVTVQDNETSWFLNWKQYAASIVILGSELMINKGNKTKLFNLLGQRTKDASQSVQNKIVEGIFSDGTGNGSKDVTGLPAMAETVPGTTVYAGVPVANTAWRNIVPSASAGSAAVNLLTYMRQGYNSALQIGGEGPGMATGFLWCTTKSVHETWEALHVPAQRYSPTETPDFGLKSAPPFKGDPVIWDPQCNSGMMYGLDLSEVGLAVHADRNFSESEEGLQKPVNQDTFISQIFWMGNMFTVNRARVIKIAGLT